ncbi:MAG TPA: hypothetical protein VKQ32_28370 [Polyangia bacterium]|nr:hypothetical protein [Polyangia bacterium]
MRILRATIACASFLLVAVPARAATAVERAAPALHQQQFKMSYGLGIGANGIANGVVEAKINRSWYGITPVVGVRYDFLFNTPPPPDAWPPGSEDDNVDWPDGTGVMGEVGIQYRPLYLLGPDINRWVDAYVEAVGLIGTMKDRGQYFLARSLGYGGGVDLQVFELPSFDRELGGIMLSTEFREFPVTSDFTDPALGAHGRALGQHEILLGVGYRTVF